MMQQVTVKVPSATYPIVIGHNIFAKVPALLKKAGVGRDAVIISHASIERLHGARLAAVLKKAGFTVKFFNVPQGEPSKSAQCALNLIERIANYDVGRQIFCIALGGGVVGDLAGFVSAIYKRGIPYIQFPTTLLAQVDSSIGGKTGIDLTHGKNLVGAIYQPRLVVADTAVLKTLTKRQIQNGLAEAVKYGIIRDPKLFDYLRANAAAFLRLDPKVLIKVVAICAAIKADVVSRDERETKGIRTILNYGHTVGHAVEAAAKYNQYQHGEAVALGVRVAGRIGVRLGMLSAHDARLIEQLLDVIGLPSVIKGVKCADILNRMRHDKKFVAGRNRFVLARSIGRVQVVEAVPEKIIREAIEAYFPHH